MNKDLPLDDRIMNTDARNTAGTSSVPSLVVRRAVGCFTLLTFVPLWASGAFGNAISFPVILIAWIALSLFCAVVPAGRLDTTLRLVFFTTSLAAAIFLSDCLLRTFAPQLIYYRGHTEFLRRDPRYPSLPRYVREAYSERSTFGDLAAISGTPSDRVARLEIFQTDRKGFRNTARSLREPFEVLVVGDSFGMGLGVSQDEHWAALLNQEGYSVYNLSMPATCAAHGAARLILELSDLKITPRATIIVPVYTGNDLEECAKSVDTILAEGPQPLVHALLTRVEDYRSRSPLRQLGMRLVYRFLFSDPVIERRFLSHNEPVLFYTPHIKAARLSRAEVERDPKFANMVDALKRVKALATKKDADLVVVVIPPKEEVYTSLRTGGVTWHRADHTSGLAEAILSLCDQEGIPTLDLTPILSAEAQTMLPKGELLWWSDDSHWNPHGHRLVARGIAETFLSKRSKS